MNTHHAGWSVVQLRIIWDDARNLVLTVRPKEAKIFIFSPPPVPVFVVVPVVDIVGLEVNVAPDLHGGGNVVCRNNKLMAGLLSICSPGGPWRWRWWWSGHVFTDLLKMENMLSSECPLWDWAVAVWVPSPPTSSQHRVLLSSSGQLPGRNYMEDGCAPSILIISEMVFILQTHLCDDSSQFLHSQQ